MLGGDEVFFVASSAESGAVDVALMKRRNVS